METAGIEAFHRALIHSAAVSDPDFDSRGEALAKSELAMDALARRRQSKHEGLAVSIPDDYESECVSPEQSSVEFTEADLLQSVELLPITQRTVVEDWLKGTSQAETAAALHVSQATVSRHFQIAVGLLRQKINSSFGE